MEPVTIRWLGRADVLAAGGGDFAAALDDVRAGFALIAGGRATMPAEISVGLGPREPAMPGARAYALPARLDGERPVAGLKWTAHRPPLDDGAPSILSTTTVNDALTGRPIGIVESAGLTVMRTAAVTALALETVAPQPLRRIAVLGAGQQATGHLAMLAALAPHLAPDLAEIRLWNRTAARGEALVARFAARLPIRFVGDIDQALDGADAVLACTAALEPVLPVEAVRPGRLVAQIGHHEAPFAAIDRATQVFVDLWGPFAEASGKSLFRMYRAGRFAPERVTADLAAMLAGAPRPGPDEAVYVSSFGLNVFDVALAARILARAEALGIGTPLTLLDRPWEAP
ncbi:ornithine cyclodeaminase [Prosthecomicrobium hirschii]|uniref:ornithine cyclodeaminase n=1 Tax=Prosthecodimorpha hirschii TaxID=665126 RepID=UPI000AFA01B7|nr:ornithine cyclodeaminase [Prosthecomicrobium hirschii]